MNSLLNPVCITLISAWQNNIQYNITCIVYNIYTGTSVMIAFILPILLTDAHGGCLFTQMSANHSNMFCWFLREDESERYEEEMSKTWTSGREREQRERDRQRLPEVMRRLNSISLLKNLLYKTNYFSKGSFHCVAVGLCATTWLRAHVRLFVFIMWRAVMNAWDDLFFCFSVSHTAYLQI